MTEACRKEAPTTQFAGGAEMAAFGDTDVVGLCRMEVRTEGHAILHGDTVSSAFICYKMPLNKWHKYSSKKEMGMSTRGWENLLVGGLVMVTQFLNRSNASLVCKGATTIQSPSS